MQLSSTTLLQGGKYRIEKVLGQGGFGITYLALQVGLNRKVAIKEFFMKEYCNRDGETSQVSVGSLGSKELVARFRQKFLKEAQTIAALDNPHIIRIYDIFEENGTAYYVMEYLQDGDLRSRIPGKGMTEAESVGYIRQIADALAYIHERKILHLDIKPTNILFRGNEAVLIDFGIAKHYDAAGGAQTSTTPVGISHGYAPMEQYKEGGVAIFSSATDIYSLGATFYKMLTGITPPVAGDVYEDGLPPLPAHLSQPVVTAIKQAMQPRRKDRPQSVAAFLSLLDENLLVDSDYDEETLIIRKKTTSKTNNTRGGKKQTRNTTLGGLSNTIFMVNCALCGFAALASTIDFFRIFSGRAANPWTLIASPCLLIALYMAYLYRKKMRDLDLYRMTACEVIGGFFISFDPGHPDDIYLVFIFIAGIVALLLSVKFQHK